MTDRQPAPPYDPLAEIQILGACLQDVAAAMDCVGALAPEDFYLQDHADVFRAIRHVVNAGQTPNLVTGWQALGKLGKTDKISAVFLASLVDQVHTWAGLADIIRVVRKLSLRRRLIELSGRLAEQAGAWSDPEEVIAAAEAELAELAWETRRKDAPHVATAITAAAEMVSRNEKRGWTGWPTGLPSLDQATGGMAEGQTWGVGGYTSTGKSTLLVGLALAVAEAGGRVAFFSLEMPPAISRSTACGSSPGSSRALTVLIKRSACFLASWVEWK